MTIEKVNNSKYRHRITTKLPYGYLEKLESKRYSDNTIKIYTAYFKDFVNYSKEKDLETISKDEINKDSFFS